MEDTEVREAVVALVAAVEASECDYAVVAALVAGLVEFTDAMLEPMNRPVEADVVSGLVAVVALASTDGMLYSSYELLKSARLANPQSFSAEVNEMRRLAQSASARCSPIHRQLSALLDPPPSLVTPASLEVLDEDELEERWDDKGRPDYLRRNLLGHRYAPRDDCLRFMRRPTGWSDSDIYAHVRQHRQGKAIDDERRRIARLNKRTHAEGHWLHRAVDVD
ncbi:hypothetical protein ACHHYP_15195 [Achlya hypogyna]|uniref:Uncharacterized protein n=1 Tax=Achlya hypogyna TaxID=1202772 RepID=A0A1V9YBD3_ACHHY|nr:hypothetical protein ACHHYP_15195 [Achlya hypogyna]